MQTNPIPDQQRRQHHAFQGLANHEHRNNAQHWIEVAAKLEQPGHQRRADTNHETHVRYDRRQTGDQADQQAQFQANCHQAGGVDNPQGQHHQQLASHECAEHLVALLRQRHNALFTVAWQQAADFGHHDVPVTQQVERYHRNQHQVGQPADQRQAGRRGLAQDDTDDIGGLPHMLTDRRLDLVELPETIRQPQLGLRPRHRRVLQPVEHLRRQFIQAKQLLGQHRHQHQYQRGDDQREQRKHRHDA